MSADQADHFANSWSVLDQFTDATGVSATVFQARDAQGNPVGQKNLAIRGTEASGNDLAADGILALGIPSALSPQFAALKTKLDTGWLKAGGLLYNQTFTVSGHSLGGYLAAAVKQQYGTQVTDAYLFNAPGIGGPLGNLADALTGALGLSGTPGGNIWNVRASEGFPFISGLGSQLGTRIDIQTEAAANALNNHSIVTLTDALAIQAAYAGLAPSLTQSDLNALIDASGNPMSLTFEAALDALRTVFAGTTVTPTPENRNTFYANLYALQNQPTYKAIAAAGAQITVLAGKTKEYIADRAKQDSAAGLATRYALKALNPFALVGVNYAAFTADGALDRYSSETGTGDFTDNYLADRANFLVRKMWFSTEDKNPVNPQMNGTIGTHLYEKEETYFADSASGYTIAQGLIIEPTRRYLFGDATGNILTGGSVGDSLYGGSGNDALQGKGGPDWIEGGRDNDILVGGTGDDILLGGQGFDSYLWNTGDGDDKLMDVDRQGRILINGSGVKLLIKNGTVWQAPDGNVTLTQGDTWKLNMEGGGSIDLGASFSDGDFGIRLYEEAPGPTTTRTLTGTAQADAIDDRTEGGAISNDLIQGLDGNDTIASFYGGDDRIEGGADDDWMIGADGNDLVIGGAGRDVLVEGAGNDRLYAGDQVTVRAALAAQNATPSRLQGEALSGGSGDDLAIGGIGNDLLLGGTGRDLLLGGAGDDTIDGDIMGASIFSDWSVPRTVTPDSTVFGGFARSTDFQNMNIAWSAEGGDDIIYAGGGDDWVTASHGNDYVDGGAGDDVLAGGGGHDEVYGGIGNDVLYGDAEINGRPSVAGDDMLDGGEGDDSLTGEGGNDTLIGGMGVDHLDGGSGDDTYLLAAGESALGTGTIETIADAAGTDTLRFGPGIRLADLRLSRVGASDLLLAFGQDRVVVQGGLTGALERLEFADGSRQSWAKWVGATLSEAVSLTVSGAGASLQGGNMADTLTARGGGAQVAGGGGNDRITVLGSNNTLSYSRGDGTDRVTTASGNTGNGNVLRLSGVTAASLKLGLGSLAIRVGADANDVIHFESFERDDVLAQRAFDHIEFDDGSTLGYEALLAGGFDLAGSDGADVIEGSNVSDRIVGGAGADSLSGGRGNDSYYFARGDGQDQISDWADTPASVNTVNFGPGISLSDLVFDRRADGSLHIGIADSSDAISLPDWYHANNVTRSIQQLVFEDGSSFDTAALDSLDLGSIRGTAGGDALVGTRFDDTIMGLAGNDVINGGFGDDILIGGAGVDSYVFDWEAVSYWGENGTDTIIEASGETSTLLLQRGMSLDLFRAERLNDDLRFRVRGGEHSVLIKDYFSGNQQWAIKSHDGSVTSMSDFLARPDPDGGDLMRAAWSDFASAARWGWNLSYQRPGNSWELLPDGRYRRSETSAGIGANVSATTTYSTEHRWAADGSMYIVQTGPNVGSVSAYAYGSFSHTETIEGFGAPQITTNTYASYLAYTQSARNQSATFQVQWTQPGYDHTSGYYQGQYFVPLNYLMDEDGNVVTDDDESPIWNEWAETRIYQDNYSAGVGGSVTSVSDGITAGTAQAIDVQNALKAAAIAAVRAGGTGGSLGLLLPSVVAGTHITRETTSHLNEFHGTAASEFLYTDTSFAADGGGGDDIIISNRGESSLAFGGDGNDKVFGGGSVDVLNGGRGDDYLGGMGGDDTYLVVRGQSGHDVIDEVVARYAVPKPGSSWSWTATNSGAGSGSTDTIRFGAGITLDDLRFSYGVVNSRMVDTTSSAAFYETLNISWAPGESIHVVLPNLGNRATTSAMTANPGSSYGIEQFRFADGSQYSMDEIQRRARDPAYQASPDLGVPKFISGNIPQATGTEGDDWLYGSYGVANYIEGLGGDDHIYGNNLGDYLSGDAGDDYLEGGLGSDILSGGVGNDTLIGAGGDALIGGAGNDRLIATGGGNTFVYNLGDGTDVIVDTSKANGATAPNILAFGSGISSGNITLDLGSLLIRVNGEQAIHIEGFDPQQPFAAPAIDQFLFADGSSLAYNDLLQRGFDICGTGDNDTLSGTAVADRITGRAGNDILAGGAGDDRYIYRLGDGSDRIVDGRGNDTLLIVAGMSKEGFASDRIGNDLRIKIAGTEDFITLDNWYLQAEGVGRIEFGDGSFLARAEIGIDSNLPPVANADGITAHENGGALTFAAANLLANDTDPNLGDVLTVIGVGSSQVGAAVTLADGQVSYDIGSAFQALAEGETVHDSFSYTIADRKGAQASSLVNVDIVGTNDAPVTVADVAVTVEDTLRPIIGNLLTNDSDVDHGTVLRIATPGDYVGTYGTLVLQSDGRYSYSLNNGSLAVQSLAGGSSSVDHFSYAVTDGLVATNSALDINVTGVNDAPVTANDAGIVVEDWLTVATGNVLTNDHDVDQGAVLQVANPGTYAGEFGSLRLGADGRYAYTLDNAAVKIQSLGRDALAVEHFGYTATDGQAGTNAVLDVFLHGTNDAPIVVTPLTDQDVTFNKPFYWQMPADSFKDVDAGDTLTYAAQLADGSALPDWLHFDTQMLAFSGVSPKAVMSLDVRVIATDQIAATSGTRDSLSVSDVFRLSISHGNQGVGNDEDAAPAGQATNFNDGAGASPGNPGAKSGKTGTATNEAMSAASVAGSDMSGAGSTQSQATPSVPAYLGLKEWQQYGPAATSGTGASDAASIFARWLAVDLAVSQALAGNGPAWLEHGLGADTAALSKATSGYLGSTHAFGNDAFSLLAGSGQNLQNFKGLAEGVQKIA